jgi:flavin reductase (DIM6/NTAB) family NADH-FMN oxidoreductase RutF
MSIEPTEFRRVLSRFATGVTVVAAQEPGGPARGLTASAIASVSLDPPLVLACVDRTADTHVCIERAGAFAISVLGAGDEVLAGRFAGGQADSKFEGVGYREAETGAPILTDALAWVDCRVWAAYDGGDHTIFVGEVLAGDAGPGTPLVHFDGAFARLAQ